MDHQRPPGFRFDAGGVNLRDQPDSLKPNKYSAAKNVRWTSDNSVVTRPGWSIVFHNGASSGYLTLTDLQTYAPIETDDDPPRILGRDASNHLVLDTGATVYTMASAPNLPSGTAVVDYGCSMIPFRPGASPQSWIYAATQGDYQKVSAPNPSSAVTVYKVGIRETTEQAEAYYKTASITNFTGTASSWTSTGTGVPAPASLTTITDYCSSSPGGTQTCNYAPHRTSISVANNSLNGYQVGQLVSIAGGTPVPIEEMWAAIPSNSIAGILYDSGSTGYCTIAFSTPVSPGLLGPGALIQIGSEICLIYDVINGPGGTSVKTYTTGAWGSGTAINATSISTIVINAAAAGGNTISGNAVQCAPITGSGTVAAPVTITMQRTWAASANPFIGYSSDDYVHFIVSLSTITNLVSATVQFDVGYASGAAAFTNVFQYAIPLAQILDGGGYTNIMIPISSLQSNGGGDLGGCTGVRLVVVTGGFITAISMGSCWVGGGSNPDIGVDGVPYQYRVVPRSSATGAVGNPSPVMRYGCSPRRQSVVVTLPDPTFPVADPQVDTYDIYRYGGSVTSYRYIGSTQAPPGANYTWTDNVSDAAATAGKALETDNFEPWPSIDVPWVNAGFTVSIVGDLIQVLTGSAYPASILRWLPGTLIQVGNNQTYTLRERPGQFSGGWEFTVEESGGSYSGTGIYVQEPFVAQARAPYMFGPDDYGTVFAVGDALRPGMLYFAKPYKPDSAPDVNNLELCPPSEPLIGGRCINGVAYVCSSNRWWAMYPSFVGPAAYQQISQPVGRTAISPYAMADDGTQIFFWTRDGISASSGGPHKSLTDADLYPLFPHEGVHGIDIFRNGVTYYTPDYSQPGAFRLEHYNGFLYADYKDTHGHYRTLVCDLRTGSWVADDFVTGIFEMACHHGVIQQAGSLSTGAARYYTLLMGDTAGTVNQQQPYTGDQGSQQINCVLATFQYDGGDLRSFGQWGDAFLDALPAGPAGLSVTPVYQNFNGPTDTIASASARAWSTVSLTGAQLGKFLGLQISWSDWGSGSTQTQITELFLWQPSVIPQPETIADRFTDWMTPGVGQPWYFRGVNITADTFNTNKTLVFRNGDDGTVGDTTVIKHNGQVSNAYSFVPPFVAHLTRIEPSDATVPWKFWPDVIRWIADPWPELLNNYSAWMNLGTEGAKYLRGVVIPCETKGVSVSLNFLSSDGGTVTMGPFSTPTAEKTEVAWAFTIPLIGHEFQIQPNAYIRIWYDEIRWDFQPWPELINEATGPLAVLPNNTAAYLRGFVLPVEDGGNPPALSLLTDTGITRALTTVPVPATGVKTGVAYKVGVPTVAHYVQLLPTSPCRLWLPEIQWMADPWPELIDAYSPWMNLGNEGAKYLRGVVIPCDTNGASISLTFLSSDGGSVTMGPFTTPAAEKTERPWAFSIPLVGHEYQIIPSGLIRIWYDEIRWDFQPWPELIDEATGWLPVVQGGTAAYLRGFVLPVEDAGNAPALTLLTDTGQSLALTTVPVPAANVKTGVAYTVGVPTVVHQVQLVPTQPCRVWLNEIQWIADPWPELLNQYSAWMNLGNEGAKYVRGVVIPCDTNGQSISLTFLSSDGGTVTMGPFTTPAAEKTERSWSFTVPLIGHEFQIIPSGLIRIWYSEIRWDFDPWPELINEATGWLPVNGGQAGFLQGFVLPVEDAGNPPQLSIMVDTSPSQTIPLTATATPSSSVKTGVAYSLATPIACHFAQIVPTSPCRIWAGQEGFNEIKWIAQPTPEVATTWDTQWTSFGLNGYLHIPYIEIAYSSTTAVTFTATASDGTSPQTVTLPANGGVESKQIVHFTFNKGLLYKFSATSSAPFQIMSPDSIVWVGQWGRTGEYIKWRGLGGTTGDQATI